MTSFSSDSNDFGNYRLEMIGTAHSERVCSSRVVDLRRSPRVDTLFKAQMISEYRTIEGMVTNLSCGGLRFEAGSELPDRMMESSGQKTGYPSEVVEICFDVPASNVADMPVVVQARIVHVLCNDEGNYLYGVEFRKFAEGEQVLIDYLHTRGVAK